nr:MAG TPA: hypothetical protein [Caudoviricetes sp.]
MNLLDFGASMTSHTSADLNEKKQKDSSFPYIN